MIKEWPMYVLKVTGPVLRIGGITHSAKDRFVAFTLEPLISSHGETEEQAIANVHSRIDRHLERRQKEDPMYADPIYGKKEYYIEQSTTATQLAYETFIGGWGSLKELKADESGQ
jgi:predicted RNase H-like HicB family nuclease